MSAEFIAGTHCDDCELKKPLTKYELVDDPLRDEDDPPTMIWLCDQCAKERGLKRR